MTQLHKLSVAAIALMLLTSPALAKPNPAGALSIKKISGHDKKDEKKGKPDKNKGDHGEDEDEDDKPDSN